MSKSPFLKDGGTRTFSIPESASFDGVVLHYRPIRADDMMELYRQMQEQKASGQPEEVAQWEVLARQIVSWDIKDESGELVPITAENIRYLAAGVYTKIASTIIDLGDTGELEKNLKTPSGP